MAAVHIAPFGTRVCQGLLNFYGDRKGFRSEICSSYTSIETLRDEVTLLKRPLNAGKVNGPAHNAVHSCLISCEAGVSKLGGKLRKTFHTPDGLREKAWTEMQRVLYSLRASTLVKLREQRDALRENLSAAISAVELCFGIGANAMLQEIQTPPQMWKNRASELGAKRID